MSGHGNSQGGVLRFLIDNSILLIAGALVALIWANMAHQRGSDSYQKLIHFDIRTLWGGGESHAPHGASHKPSEASGKSSEASGKPSEGGHAGSSQHDSGPPNREDRWLEAAAGDPVVGAAPAEPGGEQQAEPAGGVQQGAHADEGAPHGDTKHGDTKHGDTKHGEGKHGEGGHGEGDHGGHAWYTLTFLVNDVLMALFFAIAAKEVWESLLPGGALSDPRKAATPLLATAGGILGPALFYLAGSYASGTVDVLGKGWAVPCATDIAFSYLIARIIFGPGHPAIAFLLLLAIADDAAGLIILAVFYPAAPINPIWLLLTAAALALAWLLRKFRVHSHWFYLLGPGVLSWFSFYEANIHPALGLVPMIPMLPSAGSDLGLFAREELNRDDTLNEFEHFWKTPVECFLGLFGLVNAGVVLSSLGAGTWLVLLGLLVGKPVGITGMTLLAEKGMGLQKPAGMDYRHVVTLGMVAGIGFTVALFVSVAAFTVAGPTQDSVKMGALLSFAAAPLAIILAKALGVRRGDDEDLDEELDDADVELA